MDSHPRIAGGTLIRCKRAWLITWEWAGDHEEVDSKLVAVLSYRFSNSTIERIIEQVYASSCFAFHEQLAYAKSRKHNPYRVQYRTVEIGQKTREKSTLPPRVRFSLATSPPHTTGLPHGVGTSAMAIPTPYGIRATPILLPTHTRSRSR